MRSLRFILLLLGLVLGSSMGLIACRELASPQANLEDRQLVSGVVVRADGKVVEGTRVELTPQSPVFAGQYSEAVYTDDDGRFTAEAPKIPLRVDLLPTVGFGSPRRIEENVSFASGVERRFVLPGFAIPGVVADAGHLGHFDRSWVAVGLDYVDAEGEERSVWDISYPDVEGHFEAFLFQPGPVSVSFVRRWWHTEATIRMLDDWELAPGDSLLLTLPLVPIELELTLGGDPVPDESIVVRSDLPNPEDFDEYEDYLRPDGSQRVFDAAALEGTTRLQLFRSPEYGWHQSSGVWVPQLLELPAIHGGETLPVELGAFVLEIQVVDPMGVPLSVLDGARVQVASLQLSWRGAEVIMPIGGSGSVQVNSGLHRLRVTDTDYADYEEWVEITGDTSLTITLSEAP